MDRTRFMQFLTEYELDIFIDEIDRLYTWLTEINYPDKEFEKVTIAVKNSNICDVAIFYTVLIYESVINNNIIIEEAVKKQLKMLLNTATILLKYTKDEDKFKTVNEAVKRFLVILMVYVAIKRIKDEIRELESVL